MRPSRIVIAVQLLAIAAIVGACSKDGSNPLGPVPDVSINESTVRAGTDSLTADGVSHTTITVSLVDATTNAPFKRSVGAVFVFATSGTVGTAIDNEDGTYTASLTAPTKTGVDTVVARWAGHQFTHRAIVQLVAGPPSSSYSSMWADDYVLLADGASTTTVRLALYDANQNRVTPSAASVVLSTSAGTISVATAAADSTYTATLTSPNVVSSGIVTAVIAGQRLGDSIGVRFALHQFWMRRASEGTPLTYGAAAAVNGIIYSIGGSWYDDYDDQFEVYGTVSAYDASSDQWSEKAPVPTPRYGHGAAVVGGILYVIGGSTGYTALADVEAYDPATNTWTAKAHMPTPQAFLGVSVVNGIIYAVGGADAEGNNLGAVEAYDPATDSWTSRAPLPQTRSLLAAGTLNGILYAVGGSPGPSSTVFAYDPVANTWSQKAYVPTGRTSPAAGALGSKLFVLGGSDNTEFELYDPAADTWSSATPLPIAMFSGSAAIANGSLYAVRTGIGGLLYKYVP
jgi:N-acetylneuraminic acid mutarotase